jgi:hypothetical protein
MHTIDQPITGFSRIPFSFLFPFPPADDCNDCYDADGGCTDGGYTTDAGSKTTGAYYADITLSESDGGVSRRASY